MSIVYKHLDVFKLSDRLQTNFACAISDDDRIYILSEFGVYIIALKPNLDSHFAQFSCQKSYFSCSRFSLCDNVDIDVNSFVYELPKELLYECVARVDLSANLKHATPAEPCAVEAQWSKYDKINGTNCLLAVLTNLYSLEIYNKTVNESNITEYNAVLNITEELLNRKRKEFVYSVKLPPIQKFNEFKKRVEFIAPTAICWSHSFTIENESFSVLFVGHFCGSITVWKICLSKIDTKAQYEFLSQCKTSLKEIACLYWHETCLYGGALCLGDSEGKISIMHVTNLNNNECTLDNEILLCNEKNHKVDKITVMYFDDYTIIVAVKQCFLFFYGINANGKLIDSTVHSVDNLYITGLSHTKNKLKVLTFTGAFKELSISVHHNKIYVEQKPIQIKLDSVAFRTHGFIESKNKVLAGILLHPFRLRNSLRGKQFIYFHIFHNSELNPLKLLLDNDSGTIANHWDCFETLRLICLKEQRFPWLGLDPHLDYDSLSLQKLKTLRLIAKISETVFTVVKEVINYDIKAFVLLHYLLDIKLIVQRLNHLFRMKRRGMVLSVFQMQSIDLQLFFLKEAVLSGVLAKAEVGKNFIEEIGNVLAIGNEISFPDMPPCKFCGEKLIGATCLPPHADSRCCFTMQQIFLKPAYTCSFCNSLVHPEALSELSDIVCPYCDIAMDKITIKPSIIEKLEKSEVNVKSHCSSDCINENLELENIEEIDVDFVFVSDDEEESDSLKEIYFRLSKANLNEESPDMLSEEQNSDKKRIKC